jgi:hypothetical protein
MTDPILEALQDRLNADRPGWYVHGFTVALGIMQINNDGTLTHDLISVELEGQPPWTTSALLEWCKVQHDSQYESVAAETDDDD